MEQLHFGLSGIPNQSFGTSLDPIMAFGKRQPPLFSSDATLNGCGVGVGHEYLGFNHQYLAGLIHKLNVLFICQYGKMG
jgi:hypothetical protein